MYEIHKNKIGVDYDKMETVYNYILKTFKQSNKFLEKRHVEESYCENFKHKMPMYVFDKYDAEIICNTIISKLLNTYDFEVFTIVGEIFISVSDNYEYVFHVKCRTKL